MLRQAQRGDDRAVGLKYVFGMQLIRRNPAQRLRFA
jgi:hypothetical protein